MSFLATKQEHLSSDIDSIGANWWPPRQKEFTISPLLEVHSQQLPEDLQKITVDMNNCSFYSGRQRMYIYSQRWLGAVERHTCKLHVGQILREIAEPTFVEIVVHGAVAVSGS